MEHAAKLEEAEKLCVENAVQVADATQCLFNVRDQCAQLQVASYLYSICIFGDAKQDQTKLGNWKYDPSRDYSLNHTVEYLGGQRCWNGIERKLVVDFKCGEKEEIVSITEPSTCSYYAIMKSPCFCTESYVAELKGMLNWIVCS